ncbi:uncharacterized protein LOC121387305 [Gigantopelta aegis]|uniref:uncharacterized protein LOC121387305 n=1 Tax=Gigantopelta aegis TaxID=1735272 RepID=UPI001B88D00A|nr:uncharacterized protein LOC121387305 [Gigantopelta aegis]
MSVLVQVKLQSGPQRVPGLLGSLKGLLSSLGGLLSSRKSRQHLPSPPPPRNRQPESSDDEDESASPTLPAGKSKSKPQVGKGKGDKGKGKAQNENLPPGAPYSFIEAQEEAIDRWVESKKLLYDMEDKQYKDEASRRQLWEGKAAEYGVDYDSIQKWYNTQRTRFSKLREGQPKKKSQKRSGDGVSSGDEEDPILAEEASENDSDRDKFIRRVFGFLKPHIRRYKKDTPASFKDSWPWLRRVSWLGVTTVAWQAVLQTNPGSPPRSTLAINPEKLVVCVDQGHEDNGEEALVVSVHRASIPRTGDRHMLVTQSTTAVWKLPSHLKLLSNGGRLFSCSRTLDHLSSKLGFTGIADFINDKRDGVWSNSEVVGQA